MIVTIAFRHAIGINQSEQSDRRDHIFTTIWICYITHFILHEVNKLTDLLTYIIVTHASKQIDCRFPDCRCSSILKGQLSDDREDLMCIIYAVIKRYPNDF